MSDRRRVEHTAQKLFAPGGRVPAGWEPFWQAFLALHETRGDGFNGPAPIAFAEIEAYARLARLPLEPHHVDIIRALDRAWIDKIGEGRTQAASATLSPEAFDAVF